MSEVIRGGAQAQTEATRPIDDVVSRVKAAAGVGVGPDSPSLTPTETEDLFRDAYAALVLQRAALRNTCNALNSLLSEIDLWHRPEEWAGYDEARAALRKANGGV